MTRDIPILILDDDEHEWEFIKHVFDAKGIKPYSFYATSEPMLEVLKMIRNGGQIIVLDYRLRIENGYEVMMKAKEICNHCYYIIATGSTIDETDAKIINEGTDFFMIKTINYAEDLAIAIEKGRDKIIYKQKEVEEIKKSMFKKAQEINRITDKLSKHEPGSNP